MATKVVEKSKLKLVESSESEMALAAARTPTLRKLESTLASLGLILLGGWLGLRLVDGSLNYYLHPRFNLAIALTGMLFIFLGGWRAWQNLNGRLLENRALNGSLLVGLVALAGLLITPRPLDNSRLDLASTGSVNSSGTSSTATRSLSEALAQQNWNDTALLDTGRWNLLEWTAALNDAGRAARLQGRPVDITGFVSRPATPGNRYFMLARYVVVCCTADSTALRLPVLFNRSQDLEDGQWVRVQGTLGKDANGVSAFIAEDLTVVARPAQPYIYP